jgi:hypothetical protein
LEKQRKLNQEFRKKDYIKNELINKLESDKMTLKEINRLKQQDIQENLLFEKNKRLSVKA